MVRIVTRLEEVREDLKKLKHEMKHEIGDFKFADSGKVKSIVADEDVEFKVGDIKPVKIKDLEIPANHIGLLSSYARNKFGHIIAIGEEVPLPIEWNRSADHATFVAALDGEVKKNDLIGILILFPVQIYR
ncbi:MAG: DUF22 domain-containing protein [Euryarchaeota archaeon]|nr:DUF22 domain-containing protein [Euryarchaeota archaeon]